MRPLVRDGDILLMEPLGARRIRIGDVVMSSVQPERIVVHRVVKCQLNNKATYYLLQGDQVSHADGWVQQEQIFGRLVAIDRGEQHIRMDHPVVKGLGLLAVLRSNTGIGRGRTCRAFRGFIKRLPVLSDYLQ